MKASKVVLILVALSTGAAAEDGDDWPVCKAVDADQLAVPACSRLIAGDLSQDDRALAYYYRGSAHLRQGDRDEAFADENKSLEINPNLAVAYMRRSAVYLIKRNRDRAIDDANRAIELDPKNARAYINRSAARIGKGDIDGGLADANKAIELDPDFAAGYIARGLVHSAKRETNLARDDFSIAAGIEPTSGWDGYRYQGDALRHKGELSGAIAAYDHWIEIDPLNAFAYRKRAEAHWQNSEPLEAMNDASSAVKINPREFEFYQFRGGIYAATFQFDRAIADLTVVVNAEPENAGARYTRAMAYQRKQQYSQKKDDLDHAIEDFTEVIRLLPDNPSAYAGRSAAYAGRSAAYARQGNAGAAKADRDRANELRRERTGAGNQTSQ